MDFARVRKIKKSNLDKCYCTAIEEIGHGPLCLIKRQRWAIKNKEPIPIFIGVKNRSARYKS